MCPLTLYISLLLLAMKLGLVVSWKMFLPGESCGIVTPIKHLEKVETMTEEELSDTKCAFVSPQVYKAYQDKQSREYSLALVIDLAMPF